MNVDTSSCDQEPIHIPGFIQPHGMLFALGENDLTVLQASDNTRAHLGFAANELTGLTLDCVLDSSSYQRLVTAWQSGQLGTQPLHVFSTTLEGQEFHSLAHRYDSLIILELEQAVTEGTISSQNLYASIGQAIARMEGAADVQTLCDLAVQEVRHLTGLDKVMYYQFDENWTGTVIAEARDEKMEAYLGQRFPASDIPRQARELYLKNKLRLICNVHAASVVITPTVNPATNRSLDLTYSTLRSVSPIHIQYLKNMGVGASMSVSIVRDGKLVGLLACHHCTPKYLSYEVRTACEFLGQILSLQLGAHERTANREQRLRLISINADLLQNMTQGRDFAAGLERQQEQLLALVNASGAAICSQEICVLLGETPNETQVRDLTEWLIAKQQDVFASATLPLEFPATAEFKDKVCGLLAISISELYDNFILWFRPEVVRTIEWAGNPEKPVESGTQTLHPRQSFEVWKELVSYQALPWDTAEIEAATDLRAMITGIVLRQAEERAQLSTQLMQSNQELEAFSYSVSHDLRAPFRHILGFANMLEKRLQESLDPTSKRYLDTITESANYAGTLVDNLLAFSHMGRSEMRLSKVDMGQLFYETHARLARETGERSIEWHLAGLPTVHGDLAMLRLVAENLLSNAIKYTRGREPAIIEVNCREADDQWIFEVSDNGVGFDMQYQNKLFGVFQRLHRNEDFEGTGIGLANVRRIVTRHGGQTWAEGVLNQGATFGFSLPKTPLQRQAGEKI